MCGRPWESKARAGSAYDVEPIAVREGVFHPKISVLTGDGECHVLVGSGNLTFGGWGGNLEGIEHLHTSFAADAIEDTADFFEHLATTDRIRHGAHARCGAVASDLRASASGRPRNGGIRLFHNLDGAILEKLAQPALATTRGMLSVLEPRLPRHNSVGAVFA